MRAVIGWLAALLPLPALAAGEGGSAGWLLAGFFLPLGLYLGLHLLGALLPAGQLLGPRLTLACHAVALLGALIAGWNGGQLLHATVLAAYPHSEGAVPAMVATTAGIVGGLALSGLAFSLGLWLLRWVLAQR